MTRNENTVEGIFSKYRPEGVRVIGTYRCNKNCSFCYQPTKSSAMLDARRLDEIFVDMRAVGFTPVYITYQGGELTVDKEAAEKLFLVGMRNFPQVFRKSLTTNGSASVEWYRSLKMFGITHLTFSLHSCDRELQKKIIALAHDGFFTVRVNCYLDTSVDTRCNVRDVYDFCAAAMIQLTICEDLRIEEHSERPSRDIVHKIIGHETPEYTLFKHQTVVICRKRGFMYWIYHHRDHYDYNNLIVLPDGSLTTTFDDVLNGKGCSHEAQAGLRQRT